MGSYFRAGLCLPHFYVPGNGQGSSFELAGIRGMPALCARGTVPALKEPPALGKGAGLGRVLRICLIDVKRIYVCVCGDCIDLHINLMQKASFPHFIDDSTKISKGILARGGRVESGQ